MEKLHWMYFFAILDSYQGVLDMENDISIQYNEEHFKKYCFTKW